MYRNFIKSFIDIFLALTGIILLSPLLLIVCLLVYINLGGPILYQQERPGLRRKAFGLLKFRSMTNKKDANGKLLPNEQRLTTFGKILRKSSLDELPSLINVLKGDLSVVGPRPLRFKYLPFYSEEQDKRHWVKPGITGYAQVNGRSALSWEEKFKLDVYYTENTSFILDLKIIVKTFISVLKAKDTTPEGGNFEMPFDEYMKSKANG